MESSFVTFIESLQQAICSAPLIYISHYDGMLIDKAIEEALGKIGKDTTIVSEFDCGVGEVSFVGKELDKDSYYKSDPDRYNPSDLMDYLSDISHRKYEPLGAKKKVFLIKNIHTELFYSYREDGDGLVSAERVGLLTMLQDHTDRYFAREPSDIYTIILLDTTGSVKVPSMIAKEATCLSLLPPTADEIMDEIRKHDNADIPSSEPLGEKASRELCRTLLGLDFREIKQILRNVTFDDGGILTEDESLLQNTLEQKRQIVKKDNVIEVIEAEEQFSDVGGLENLRMDLESKSIIFRNLNRVINDKVRLPKGIMIVGMPGCGKSLIAKAVANEFRVPLLRLDMNRILGQYVGQSEQNMKKALQSAESASPCVLWIDEIEKAFSGASGGSDDSKNDTVLRMMGMFLTWLQEHKKPVYIVATANDVMRPELMRKGRFDEVYFVDFPSESERKSIIEKKIARIKRNNPENVYYDVSDFEKNKKENICKLAEDTKGFSGAEIQSLLESVLEKAYIDYLCTLNDKKTASDNSSSGNSIYAIELLYEKAKAEADLMKDTIISKQSEDPNSTVYKLKDYRNKLRPAGKGK